MRRRSPPSHSPSSSPPRKRSRRPLRARSPSSSSYSRSSSEDGAWRRRRKRRWSISPPPRSRSPRHRSRSVSSRDFSPDNVRHKREPRGDRRRVSSRRDHSRADFELDRDGRRFQRQSGQTRHEGRSFDRVESDHGRRNCPSPSTFHERDGQVGRRSRDEHEREGHRRGESIGDARQNEIPEDASIALRRRFDEHRKNLIHPSRLGQGRTLPREDPKHFHHRERHPVLPERREPNIPGRQTPWQQRRAQRQRLPTPPLMWRRSPSPPRNLSDRLKVGIDERRRKERRRERKVARHLEKMGKRTGKDVNTMEASSNEGAEKQGAYDAEKQQEHEAESKRAYDTGKQHAYDGDHEESMRTHKFPKDSRNHSFDGEEDDDIVLGPAAPKREQDHGRNSIDHGRALRPGEGEKMAAFIQDGARIPRRGEIGLSSDQIENFERQGYVMSGSRNRRMEAVRMRKENQVYSAEELAALGQFSREERQAREEKVLNQFRMLVKSKMGSASQRGADS